MLTHNEYGACIVVPQKEITDIERDPAAGVSLILTDDIRHLTGCLQGTTAPGRMCRELDCPVCSSCPIPRHCLPGVLKAGLAVQPLDPCRAS